jgi:catechol 2,3-dioxygenase-like lactoylglutathione lyase family enzyme
MFEKTKAFCSFSVDSLAAAKKFYSEVLGLGYSEDPMGITLKFADGYTVYVYEKSSHIPATFTVLNFMVDNIDLAVDELKNKGVKFEYYDNLPMSPQDEKGISRGAAAKQGPDIAWFKDPAGNTIAILQAI